MLIVIIITATYHHSVRLVLVCGSSASHISRTTAEVVVDHVVWVGQTRGFTVICDEKTKGKTNINDYELENCLICDETNRK